MEEDERRLAEYLPESVYVWACGEKLDPADEDVAATDITIGWLTLVVRLTSRGFMRLGRERDSHNTVVSWFTIQAVRVIDLRFDSLGHTMVDGPRLGYGTRKGTRVTL